VSGPPAGQVDRPDDAEVYASLASRIAARAGDRPIIVGIGGSVAVGKSTVAAALQQLLADRWSVEIMPTDGFLLSNEVLAQRGLIMRKGFPESYDGQRLTAVLAAIKDGQPDIDVPVYDHRIYDVVTDRLQTLGRPDVVIVEGVNALAEPSAAFLDLAIYVDADETDIRAWFVARFQQLADAAASDPQSFFARWSELPTDQVAVIAETVWDQINGVNLRLHIEPTRSRADVVLVKGRDHRITEILTRDG
jgi:type I pantothenate kinase